MIQVIDKITKRSLERYKSAGWRTKVVGRGAGPKRVTYDDPIWNEPFEVGVGKEKGEPARYRFMCTMGSIVEVQRKAKKKIGKSKYFDPPSMVEKFKAEPVPAVELLEPETDEEIEQLAHDICEQYCRGDMDIMEICGHHKVKFTTFMQWVFQNAEVNRMFTEAMHVAKTLMNIRMYHRNDQMIMQMLIDGGVHSTKEKYAPRLMADGTEVMELTSSEKMKRGFNLSELLMMKKMLVSGELNIPDVQDDFEKMSTDELSLWIRQNGHLLEGGPDIDGEF